jgi:hypothetical protein
VPVAEHWDAAIFSCRDDVDRRGLALAEGGTSLTANVLALFMRTSQNDPWRGWT